jgi:hypothetical protein
VVVGQQVGQYRILEQIGAGGMGAVYRAEHVMLGRHAAVKVLHSEFGTRPEIVTRFFNEARAATQIADPGIVQIFDFGQHDGRAYIVMELLVGETLDARIRRVGVLEIGDAMRVMRQVASSLGAAHARGIVHRDLKPENIFLCRDPEVAGGERAKLLDFGIAKLTQDTGGAKTSTSAVIGTPLYMSPEQCRGAGGVDQRSDVYSLGCVLYAVLTGTPPFDAVGHGELIIMHVQQVPVPPSHRAPGIPPALDALVLRCLEKDPARRFNSGTELAHALEMLRTGSYPGMSPTAPGHAAASLRTVAMHPGGNPTTLSSAGALSMATPVPQKSRGGVYALLGVVVAAGVGAAVIASMKSGAKSDNAPIAAQDDKPAPTPTPPAPTPPALTPPAPTPPAPPPVDHRGDDALAQIKAAVAAMKPWTQAHPKDACPTPAALGAPAADPWGTALVVTCTEQPANQLVGVTSAGPDTKLGTDDDLHSWSLGEDVTALVAGARWKPAPSGRHTSSTSHKPPTDHSNDSFVDLDGDGIPDKR